MAWATSKAAGSKWTEASEYYERALAAAPSNASALFGMGSAQLQLGRNEEALPFLERAAQLRPDDWELAKLLAGSQMKAGK